jgi:spore germination protein YaaH/flagellar hook assembly protein FlgD
VPQARSALFAARPLIAATLALLVASGVMPGPATAQNEMARPVPVLAAAGSEATVADAPVAGPPDPATDPSAGPDAAAQHPSTAYEQAMAHADDTIAFKPGGRVKVGFKPRATDDWPVDNQLPTALPAGRATGAEMADSPQGSDWAHVNGSTPAASTDPGPAHTPTDEPIDGASAPLIDARAVSAVTPVADQVDLAAARGLRRQVFGFLPYWELSGAVSKLNNDVLSTIAYFSVGVDRLGNLRKKDADGSNSTGWGGWTSSSMTSVISNAHQHGTRVVLTVSAFAWTTSQANVQRAVLGSSTARLRLARQIAAAVRDRGADGVNLDFEPIASGYSDEFVSLLRTVRSQLNRVRKGYQLTYDTTGFIGNYPIEASVAKGAADAIFIMGYDYRTSSSSTAGSVDPLSGPTYDLADTVRAYTARVSASRIILGIPWYGRAWSTAGNGPRSKNTSGAKFGYSTAVNYETVADLVKTYGRRWDPVEASPYIVYRRQNCTAAYGCVTSWRQVYYDDAASLKQRYALVNDYGLRGAGMWALGFDGGRAELYRAVSESFLVDKSAPQAGIRILAPSQGDEGFVVSWAARDTSAVVSYDVQVSTDGGAWKTWLTRTRAASDVWLGADGHGYAFRVRAVDSKHNAGSWNIGATWDATPSLATGGFGRVVKDGLAYRAGPHTSSVRLGSLPANTIVAITRGPVSADGYAWYEVTEPIREWSPVSFVQRGVWIAARSSSATFVKPYRAPNSTTVDAGLRRLDFGAGPTTAVGSGTAQTALRAFSPNHDGSRDSIRLRWTNTVALDGLTLRVYRTNGTLVGSRSVPKTRVGAQTWDWNGVLGRSTVKNGRYVLQLVGTAGSRTFRAPSARPITAPQLAKYAVTIDTVAPVVTSAKSSVGLLSPNGDGIRDSVRLTMASTGATRWALLIASRGGTIRTAGGTGGSIAFTWHGDRPGGARVPDGTYTAILGVMDAAGNQARRSFPIIVDTTGPVVVASATTPSFSPDGDGVDETTRLAWTANERATGTVRIRHGATVIRSWAVTNLTAWAATWNGRDAKGRRVADGRYELRITVVDAGGNRRVVSKSIVIDRTGGFLRWSRAFDPQDGDALAPTSTLRWKLTRNATTALRLYDASGKLVRTVWTGRAQRTGNREWTWNGRLANGTYAAQGRYEARLGVTSSLGTVVLAQPVWAGAFAVTPSATTVKAGQTLRIAFTTIEALRTKPVVMFKQPGRAAVSVTATRRPDGSYLASFKVRTGARGTASVQVSATDSAGAANRSAIAIRVAS